MIIKRTKIQSFGSTQGETFNLDPKLNVIYGPNEAGKSTLRSFITTTLFPKSGLKYPSQKKSDSGTVEVELSDGSLRTYSKEGKSSNSDAPELCGIDDKEYISIYSMSPSDLRDMKSIEKGGIRNRFLTIPGGADLPNAYSSLDQERFDLLPEKRRSATCTTSKMINTQNQAKNNVDYLKNRETGDAHYAELVSKRNELDSKIAETEEIVKEKDLIRNNSLKADALANAKKSIEELESEEKELAYSEKIDDQTLTKLENEVSGYKIIADKAAKKLKNAKSNLNGHDHTIILKREKEISYIEKKSLEYEREKKSLNTPPQPKPQPKPVVAPSRPEPTPIVVKKGISMLTIIGMFGVALGIVLAIAVNIAAGILLGMAGAALAIFGFVKNKPEVVYVPGPEPTPVPDPEPKPMPEPTVQKTSELVEYVDATLKSIMTELGIKSNGFHSDLQKLIDLVSLAHDYQNALNDAELADKDLKTAEEKVSTFLSGFGGKEKYEKALNDKTKLGEIRASLKTLKDSMETAPITEIDSTTAKTEYDEANNLLQNLKEQRGSVNQAIVGILNDNEVEHAITVWKDAESAAYEAVLEWASLTLERILLDTASEEAYNNHRPDVLDKADNFLNLMTCGRYRMNTDPRITDIAVIDVKTDDLKTDSEWSSGLEDQIKLSLKLAVSLSLSKEKPPVILDDILLTSDSERKMGACKAISSLSEDVQVLFFTCDKETCDNLKEVGANVISI